MADSFIRHGAPELVKQLTRKGTNVVAKNWNTPASLKPLLQTLNPETIQAIPQELAEPTIRQIADEAVVNPENARIGLGLLQDGVQNNRWSNYGAWQVELEKKWNIQTQKNQLEAPVPSKEPIAPSQEAPTRYDVEGLEGRRSIEAAAKPWFDEQLERIGWDPKRTGEIDRSQFAQEGIFVDGEKYNFAGLTKYARDRKTIPKLKPSARGTTQLAREANEIAQTFGPAMRPKPTLVDLLGEIVPAKNVHKHHVLLLKVIEPWTRKADGSMRDKAQLKKLVQALAKRDWWIGNTDKNLVWQSIGTHYQDAASSHGLLKQYTDIQGRGKGEIPDIPGKTYDPNAMHGFSNEFIAALSKEKDTKKLITSLLMFLEEGGGGEAMEGAAYSAQKNLEPRAVVKKKGKVKEVESGDILHDRRMGNPRVQQNVESLETGIKGLKKPKKSK